MKLAIHQPEFMPWMGFFYKMAKADVFVIFDHVQFKKRYFENRNRVVSPQAEVSYLRVPVLTKGSFTQAINHVKIDNTQKWQTKLLGNIRHSYNRSPYFETYYDELAAIIDAGSYQNLIDLNLAFIRFFRKHLNIHTRMIFSSEMSVDAYRSSDLILQICVNQRADTYLCGSSGKNYLRSGDFEKHGIQIEWLNFKTPVYRQLCSEFIPNLCTLDLLFNHGYRSKDILFQLPN